jgi:hypothetical protein
MSRFDLDLENLPKPHSLTVTESAGGLQVLIGLDSAEDALAYAKALKCPVEADSTRPIGAGAYLMRSVRASRTSPGVHVFLAGASTVTAESAVPR